MKSFTILALLITVSSGQGNCPSDSWIECANFEQNCEIPGSIKAASISYGSPSSNSNEGKWVFTEVTNVSNTTFKVYCFFKMFGDADPGAPAYCCYNIKDQVGPSTNEANWQFLAAENSQFRLKQPTYIRFGIYGKYAYRWMGPGTFLCGDYQSSAANGNAIQWFADVNTGILKRCYSLKNSTATANSIGCGDSTTDQCNLKINNNGGGMQLIRYGVEGGRNVYSYGYAQNGVFPCGVQTFGNANSGKENFCWVLNQTNFVGASGRWSVAASCGGVACIINEEIEYGVTSTTSESCTQSWTQSLSESISGSLSFIIASETKSLTLSQSTTVSETVSASYSVHISKDCGVNCGNGTAAIWTLYQWVMIVGEYVGPDIVPFDIDTCYYICSTASKPPQCPPTYCNRNSTGCTECSGYP